MQGTKRIYEAPSRLSQGLVVGLSIAVVLMAGWLAVTITLSQSVTTSAEGATGATASPPGDRSAVSAAPDTLRPAVRSVHFDWPEQFASATARPSAPPPAQTALPPVSTELPVAPDLGRSPWPAAVPGARDRIFLSRRSAGGAAEATDVIVDVASPPPSRTAAAREAAAPTQRQAQRRQKPRVDNEPAQ